MERKIKILNELKEFCSSVDDLSEVNTLNYFYNSIIKVYESINKCIDLKIAELLEKKEKEENRRF